MDDPHADTATAVHHYLHRLDADGPKPDPTDGRRLVIARHADGSICGRFDLDAVDGEKRQTALEAVVLAGRCAGEERTRAQQLADALVQLCDTALAGGLPTLRGHQPQVLVKVGIEDLTDSAVGRGAAATGFGATISAARARWLACDGAVTRIVTGPDGLPLDHGRTVRLVPPHVRRAAEVRDGGCVFTGCGAPTHWCDVHHLLAWIDGGQTSLDNSALLCERHSHLVCTTASGSSDNQTGDGAPGAPTAPRSAPDRAAPAHPSPAHPSPARLFAPPPDRPADARSTWNVRQACVLEIRRADIGGGAYSPCSCGDWSRRCCPLGWARRSGGWWGRPEWATSATASLSRAGPLLVAGQTQDPFLGALGALLHRLPWLIFGLQSGVLADRVDRRRLLIGVDLARGGVLVVLATALLTGDVGIAVVLAAPFVLGVAEVFADTTSGTLLPTVVRRPDLGIGNALLMTGALVLNEMVGPALGADLFVAGMAWPFVTEAVLRP